MKDNKKIHASPIPMVDNIKRNKIAARSIIIAGTILAGLGLWTAVSHAALPVSATPDTSMTVAAPTLNSNFSSSDFFLTQSGLVQGPSTGQQSGSLQQAPARAPRVRTRGS